MPLQLISLQQKSRNYLYRVTYQSKYGKQIKEYNPPEWMAALVSHIPDRGSQTIHYYGYYSNATKERLKKDDSQPGHHIIEDDS